MSRWAALTIVHNERVFLPIWLEYYSRFFYPEDIYVLDHQSTDGSTSGPGFVREIVEHAGVDHAWMRDRVQQRQHELLKRYDGVLVTDVDEIVAPDPAIGTLGDYLAQVETGWVNCVGYEVLHRPDRELAYDPKRPILAQRGYWFWSPEYSKPALAREPMYWVEGFHARTDGRTNADERLRLIHLHRMDHDVCLDRHRLRQSLPWSEDDVGRGLARHNRLADSEQFEHWFGSVAGIGFLGGNTERPIVLEPIEDRWCEVV